MVKENGIYKVILVCFLLFIMQELLAAKPEKYRIVFLSTKSIKIGDKLYKRGDTFTFPQEIHWKKDKRQMMRVVKVDDEQQRLYNLDREGLKDFEKQGSRSLFDYLVQENYLGTRKFGKKGHHYSMYPHHLADTLMFPINTVDSTLRAEAFWMKGNQEIVTPLGLSENKRFYIVTPRIYADQTPCDIKLSIREISDDMNWTNLVYQNIPILYVPTED